MYLSALGARMDAPIRAKSKDLATSSLGGALAETTSDACAIHKILHHARDLSKYNLPESWK